MNKENKQIWFPAKKYGIGWGLPVAWQGWMVLLTYIFLSTAGAFAVMKSPEGIFWFLPYILLLTMLLIFICRKKGEKLELSRGNKK